MMEDELLKIWKSSPNQERIKFEKSRLMLDLQSGLDRFHRFVKYRDLMDTIPAIIIIPVFASYAFIVPFALSKIASGCIALWGIYLLIRLRKAKKNKPDRLSGSYLEYLKKNRRFLMDQKELMDTVLYWAVIPLIVLVSLFFIGVFIERPGPPIKRAIALGGNVMVGVAVYYMNRWAVKKQIIPKLEKVDQLINMMEKE